MMRYKVGDRVRFKRDLQLDNQCFIWESIILNSEKFVVINISSELTRTLRLKIFEQKEEYKLFQNLEYVLVKEYDLLKVNCRDYEIKSLEILEYIILNRKETFAEIFFLFYLKRLTDFIEIDPIWKSLQAKVISDKFNSFLNIEEEPSEELRISADKINRLSRLLFNLCPCIFFEYKQIKNMIEIFEKVIMDDKRSFYQTIKDDYVLFDALIPLVLNSNDYKSLNLNPKNTKALRPSTIPLNESLVALSREQVLKHVNLKNEMNRWKRSMEIRFPGISITELRNMLLNFDAGEDRKLRKLLFSDIHTFLPIKKMKDGKIEKTYNLMLLKPFFDWIEPGLLALPTKLANPREEKSYYVRKVKEYISTK